MYVMKKMGFILIILKELDELITQEIEFGKNMISFEEVVKGDELVTGVIPLGAKQKDEEGNDTELRLTIASVNGGLDYIQNDEAVQQYGKIFTTQIWDDVTLPENLLAKGQEWLANAIMLSASITLNAVDLSYANKSISSFRLGANVKVKSKLHNLDAYFLVSKLSLELLNPKNDKLTLGVNYKTFTEQVSSQEDNIVGKVLVNVGGELSNISNSVAETERRLTTQIEAVSSGIMTSVSDEYVTKDEQMTLEESINTRFEQTASSFDFAFQETNKKIDESSNQSNSKFESIEKHIRFEDGDIILKASDSEIHMRIENDQLAFYENNVKFGYMQNRKASFENGEFDKSLRIGKMGFTTFSDGSGGFGKVVK